jgi:hypothetical protein
MRSGDDDDTAAMTWIAEAHADSTKTLLSKSCNTGAVPAHWLTAQWHWLKHWIFDSADPPSDIRLPLCQWLQKLLSSQAEPRDLPIAGANPQKR